MVERHLAARGIRDPRLLAAMGEVPRERFVAERLREFAYEDAPLPIAAGQTISQPFIVAEMIRALELEPDDRVLEIGVGSGYAAAVMSRVAAEVYAMDRHQELVDSARQVCRDLGYDNVHLRHGDGTLGWPEHAPYDAISVAAAGPEVPQPLLDQLAVGGRLVLPVGSRQVQELVRIERVGEDEWRREELGGVRFVPLVGEAGWSDDENVAPAPARSAPAKTPARGLPALLADASHPFEDVASADLGPVAERLAGAKVVLMGEATHGTSEFYRYRARLTRELVEHHGFNVVAVEADWPDAARVDRHIRQRPETDGSREDRPVFSRFPRWMWRNREFAELISWLQEHNAGIEDEARKVSFHGLDLYSLHSSIEEVVRYLEDVDPEAAEVARLRYGCLTPWEQDPALYGRAALSGRYDSCEDEVVAALMDLLESRLEYSAADGERFLDAERNARLVAGAERYYRVMYYGSRESWNLRDRHMFDTLESVLAFRGDDARAVVWAHNSHNGDARATEMGARGETNLGQLSRESFGERAFLLGFGTDHGTVAAASNWGAAMEVKDVRPSHEKSYEHLCHRSGSPGFFLPLTEPLDPEVPEALEGPRLERAIGVIYRPETELASHYFQASLPRQFDAWVWIDETRAVEPLPGAELGGDGGGGLPDTFPFGV